MSTKVNQQQTLFRFVSLRAPELTNPTDRNKKFVFDNNVGDSYFSRAVEERPLGQSKWEAMKLASGEFNPIDSSASLEQAFSAYWTVATWISRNRAFFKAEELDRLIEDIVPLEEEQLRQLWDNLYYQVVTQQSFYIKEGILQLMVLQNLLVNKTKFTKPEEVAKYFPMLANARVVLAVELFTDELPNDSPEPSKNALPVFSSKKLETSLEIALAASQIEHNDVAITELTKLDNRYKISYETAYQEAQAQYQEEVDIAYSKATIIEKERIECPSNCKVIYYEYEGLELPHYKFEPPIEIDPAQLKLSLSPESYFVVDA